MKRLLTFAITLAALTVAGFAFAGGLSKKERVRLFDLVWSRVKERHYDPGFNGVDWNAVRKRYAPRIAASRSDQEFYDLLRGMVGELKQSHFAVIPPGGFVSSDERSESSGEGTCGISARWVEDRAVVTEVAPGSPAERAGIRPGFALTHAGGRSLEDIARRLKPRRLRPNTELAEIAFALTSRLSGPSGGSLAIRYLDGDGRPGAASLDLEEPRGERVQFGMLPPLRARFESRRLEGGFGYIRFNLFLMPVLPSIQQAVRDMADAPGIVLDLRGNPGGLGMMASAVAALFCEKRASLGVMRMRQGELRFAVFPNAEPYRGPVVILVDEASLSTSEILAAGLQELGRATVIGRTTGGMALPSQIEELAGGLRLQYPVADFRTPRGVLIEGRGVQPDVPVNLSRTGLLAESDPILACAIRHLRNQASPSRD